MKGKCTKSCLCAACLGRDKRNAWHRNDRILYMISEAGGNMIFAKYVQRSHSEGYLRQISSLKISKFAGFLNSTSWRPNRMHDATISKGEYFKIFKHQFREKRLKILRTFSESVPDLHGCTWRTCARASASKGPPQIDLTIFLFCYPAGLLPHPRKRIKISCRSACSSKMFLAWLNNVFSLTKQSNY